MDMDTVVREWDVCLHRPTNRRVLVVAAHADGTARCVAGDDRYFECPTADLLSYRHPKFDGAAGRWDAARPPGRAT